MTRRRRPIADQRLRTRQLDEIRLQRPLRAAELAEADGLVRAEYMRAYMRQYRIDRIVRDPRFCPRTGRADQRGAP